MYIFWLVVGNTNFRCVVIQTSIQNFQPVEERKIAPQEDARGDLLSEIRKGCKLKPVEERDIKPISNPPPDQGGAVDLSTALKKALAERSMAIHSEDDDDDVSSDDEWD